VIKVVYFLFSFLVLSNSAFAGKKITDEDFLINLPETAALKINTPFIVSSMQSRSGTGTQSAIVTKRIYLTEDSEKAKQTREENRAAIELLKELKNFDEIERVLCFVDFNADTSKDLLIPHNTVLKLSKPLQYGPPVDGLTEEGSRVTISNIGNDKSVSGNFADKIGRRLYCNFFTGFVWGSPGFLNDLKIKHLKVLLAPTFELIY
jgi:hypothetical protein